MSDAGCRLVPHSSFEAARELESLRLERRMDRQTCVFTVSMQCYDNQRDRDEGNE